MLIGDYAPLFVAFRSRPRFGGLNLSGRSLVICSDLFGSDVLLGFKLFAEIFPLS